MVGADVAPMPPRLSALPLLSGLKGVGGTLKVLPAHFRVVELAEPRADRVSIAAAASLKESSKHAHVTLTREGQTTREVVGQLSRAFSVAPESIGFAGLKDKYAICTQTFSLPRDELPDELRESNALRAIGERCVHAGYVLEGEPEWHRGKLRPGQLRGNRFEIVVSQTDLPPTEALSQARRIADALRHTGWANFFGPQRFGKSGPTAALARSREILADRSGRGRGRHAQWLDTLLLNSLQSALFNEVVTRRVEGGKFHSIWPGDLVCPPSSVSRPRTVKPALEVGEGKGTSSEWAFAPNGRISDADAAAFAAGEITFTGPLFGAKMAKAHGAPGDLEASVWKQFLPAIPLSSIKTSVLCGGRRIARLPLPADLEIREDPETAGLKFCFTLPRGSYATSLLREFVGRECDSPEDAEARAVAEACEEEMGGKGVAAQDSMTRVTSSWVDEGAVGLRLSCECVLDEKKAIAQCLGMIHKYISEPVPIAETPPRAGSRNCATEAVPASSASENRMGALEPCAAGMRFSVARTGAAGLLLLRCPTATPEVPVRLAMRALDEALETGKSPAPLAVRLLPSQAACPANVAAIMRAFEPLLDPITAAVEEERTFCIEVKQRGARRADRKEVISEVGRLVRSRCPTAQVDLERAHFALTIDVFDGTAVLAVLPHWHRLHYYNLRVAAASAAGNKQEADQAS